MMGFLKRVFGNRSLPERLSYEEARAILERHKSALEEELAGRRDVQPEVLYYLAQNGKAAVRRAVAANPAAPAHANSELADDPDVDVRAELARKIGRLFPELSAQENGRLRDLAVAALERLARDELPRVRRILAEEIRALDCVPKRVIDALARDAEEAVCVPILQYSPLLTDRDLIEIIASARVRGALEAVARRNGLSSEVADAIAATLDIPAVAALLANPSAQIREDTLDRIIEHAGESKAWHAPLVLRTDLSVRAIRRIAGFVAGALIEKLAGRHGLDAETQGFLNQKLRQRLETEETSSAVSERETAQARVAQLRAAGGLDASLVERAVDTGDHVLAIETLAALSGIGSATTRRIFASGSGKAVTALCWKAGLSMRIAFRVQVGLAHLKGDELLPAREGVDYPLSEDEMRWHLGYFGVEAT